MIFSQQQLSAFGLALNEARLLGLRFDHDRSQLAVTLAVNSIPEGAKAPPADPRIVLTLEGVWRIAASLRRGHWDDMSAPVEHFEIGALDSVVRSFEGGLVYGRRFLDEPESASFADWADRISASWVSDEVPSSSHSLYLYQEAVRRHLDVCVWFASLHIHDAYESAVSFDDFTAAGARWWTMMDNTQVAITLPSSTVGAEEPWPEHD